MKNLIPFENLSQVADQIGDNLIADGVEASTIRIYEDHGQISVVWGDEAEPKILTLDEDGTVEFCHRSPGTLCNHTRRPFLEAMLLDPTADAVVVGEGIARPINFPWKN